MTLLTLDAGNSKLRLRLFPLSSDGERVDSIAAASFDADASAPSQLKAALRGIESQGRDAPLAAALSAVGDERLEEKLMRAIRRVLGHELPVALDPGELLENGSTNPETVGRDRLFTALGGLELAPDEDAFLVADAGTALTVDLVRRRSPDQEAHVAAVGKFCGGAIAPGPDLLARSLHRGGARLPRVHPEELQVSRVPALGRDTLGALRAGIVHGFRGAAFELLERIAGEAELSSPLVLLTGGARSVLLDPPLAEGAARMREEPELIHVGLRAAARSALRETQ